MPQGIQKRGRKRFTTDLDPFINSQSPVSFMPSRVAREELAYCMKETGVYNKSAVIALAIRSYYDQLVAEAMRKAEQE